MMKKKKAIEEGGHYSPSPVKIKEEEDHLGWSDSDDYEFYNNDQFDLELQKLTTERQNLLIEEWKKIRPTNDDPDLRELDMVLDHLRTSLSALLTSKPDQFFANLRGGETDSQIRELTKDRVQDLQWLLTQLQKSGAYISTKSGHSHKPKALQEFERRNQANQSIYEVTEETAEEAEDSAVDEEVKDS